MSFYSTLLGAPCLSLRSRKTRFLSSVSPCRSCDLKRKKGRGLAGKELKSLCLTHLLTSAAVSKSVRPESLANTDRCEQAVERCTKEYKKKIPPGSRQDIAEQYVCLALEYYKACLEPLRLERALCMGNKNYLTVAYVVPKLIRELCGDL